MLRLGCFSLLYDHCFRRKAAAMMEELPDNKNQFSLPLEMPFIKSSLSGEEYEAIFTPVLCCSDLQGSRVAVKGKAWDNISVFAFALHICPCILFPLFCHQIILIPYSGHAPLPFLIAVRWCHLDVKIKMPCDAPAVPSADRPEGCMCKSQRGWTRSGLPTFI